MPASCPPAADPDHALDSSAALVRLAAGRDADAWDCLVRRHAGHVRALTRRIAGPVLGDDAAQETWLLIRRHAGRFRPTARDPEALATAWIRRIATNCACSLVRQQQRRRRRAQPLETEALPAAAAVEHGPDDQALRAVFAALAELRQSQREVLVLHYIDGLDYPALADRLGCTVNAARVRVHRALAGIRKRLAARGTCLGLTAVAALLARPLEAAGSGVTLVADHQALLYAAAEPSLSPTLIIPTGNIMLTKTLIPLALGCALATGTAGVLLAAESATPTTTASTAATTADHRQQRPTYEELLLENRRLRERLTELDQIAQTARQVAHGLNVELDKARKDNARHQANLDRIRQLYPQNDPLDARSDPSATATHGVVAAVKENPAGDQDLVMLTIPQDAELEQGTEFVIYRGNHYICKVRVERRMNDMVACRVIADTWNTSGERIAAGDLATNRLF